jgi:hypothetical protein
MPIIPFVGPSYQMEAFSFDHQRCVNLYAIVSESGSSASPSALRSTPGLQDFAELGGGPVRGGIESQGRVFLVSGSGFYEVFSDGTTENHGTLNTFTSRVQILDNPTQIMVIDGTDGYIFTKTTDTFAQIIDADFPTPSSLTFQDGYFIVSAANTNNFHISALNNGLSWGALDFTTVEGNPDNLAAVYSNQSNIWAFGTKTTEVFQNTGAASFPFQKLRGAFIQTGCAAPDTIQNIDNSLIWLGTDENGGAIVWRSNGYNATRISTQAIELLISTSDRFDESYAWTYHERGHAFYCLQIEGLNTTLVVDLSTGLWHERVYRNPITNNEEQHRGSCHVFAFNKHLVGDRETGMVYEQRLDVYTDSEDPIVRKRILPVIVAENELIPHWQFELDMEVGIGAVSGQGENPRVMMRYSDNRGRTWSSELLREFGEMGEYNTRVVWNALGSSKGRVYEVSVSDPVFVQINAAYLNGSG